HSEAVVLRGNFDAARLQILYRLVASAVAELELEGFSTERETENLMAKANPESGNTALHNIAHGLGRVGNRRWIARPIGEKYARRFVLQRFRCGRRGREH